MKLADYFFKLRDLWDEFDAIMPCPGCPCPESKRYLEHFEYQRLLQFLTGLNETYTQARNQIMMMHPTPSLNKAYSLIIDQESQMSIANLTQIVQTSELLEGAALYSNKEAGYTGGNLKFKKNQLQCEYCHYKGDSKENCFKLIGYPPDFKSNRKGNNSGSYSNFTCNLDANSTTGNYVNKPAPPPLLQLQQQGRNAPTVTDKPMAQPPTPFFTQEQYQQIIQLLSKGNNEGSSEKSTAAATAYVSHTGKAYVIEGQDISNDLWSGQVKAIGKENHGLYVLKRNFAQQGSSLTGIKNAGNNSVCTRSHSFLTTLIWHRRLGHAPLDAIKRHDVLRHLEEGEHHPCTVCPLAKQTRLPFPLSNTMSKSAFELIHCDIWGPYRVPTYDGKRYFVTIVDDFTRYTWIFLIHSKSDTLVVLKNFFAKVHNLFSTQVKTLRTDNGCEFFSSDFTSLLLELGIEHQSTCVYTPQQNGVTKRRYKAILDMARPLRFQASIPLRFWGECVNTAVYLLNRLPSKVIGYKSPLEKLYLHPPSLNHLRVFGCLTYETGPNIHDKFSSRPIPSVLLGYSPTHKGYILYNLHSKVFFLRFGLMKGVSGLFLLGYRAVVWYNFQLVSWLFGMVFMGLSWLAFFEALFAAFLWHLRGGVGTVLG
ncbi:PREDICTED: uncharacterized protein LOC109218155 [Nicotiana attenuata]|nr:PREDICTED: uncharacterized protein LOC109218155 [Nicotiana attenuata]